MSLPRPSPDQATVELYRLDAGESDLPSRLFIDPCDPQEVRRCPSMSWLVVHRPTGKKLVFDLGIRKDPEGWPPVVFDRMKTITVNVPQDAADSLRDAGLDPQSDIAGE